MNNLVAYLHFFHLADSDYTEVATMTTIDPTAGKMKFVDLYREKEAVDRNKPT